MPTALVGSTGFVGRSIARQCRVDEGYHRPNIQQLRGRQFSRLWIAGAPAQKWTANAEPQVDARALEVLAGHLAHVRAQSVVLISTVDVYPEPSGVDELTAVDIGDHPQAYGRNRLWFELAVRELFAQVLVVRLPGLFGTGLKKNLVYDLLHEREEFAHRDSIFQFYDLRRLVADVETARRAGLLTVNLATQPLAGHAVARQVFGRELVRTEGVPVQYDMRTAHGRTFGRPGQPYLLGADEIMTAMADFVAAERHGR